MLNHLNLKIELSAHQNRLLNLKIALRSQNSHPALYPKVFSEEIFLQRTPSSELIILSTFISDVSRDLIFAIFCDCGKKLTILLRYRSFRCVFGKNRIFFNWIADMVAASECPSRSALCCCVISAGVNLKSKQIWLFSIKIWWKNHEN